MDTVTQIKDEKVRFRKQVLAMLKKQSAQDRQAKNAEILRVALNLEETKRAERIMLYVSFGHEVDSTELINELLSLGKKIFIPSLDPQTREIYPVPISDIKKDTEMSPYGYREPVEAIRHNRVTLSEIDLVFVPGVAFDHKCNRLGRGWGCYDRFLSLLKDEIPTIGLSFDFQVFESIPLESFDVPLKKILTN